MCYAIERFLVVYLIMYLFCNYPSTEMNKRPGCVLIRYYRPSINTALPNEVRAVRLPSDITLQSYITNVNETVQRDNR